MTVHFALEDQDLRTELPADPGSRIFALLLPHLPEAQTIGRVSRTILPGIVHLIARLTLHDLGHATHDRLDRGKRLSLLLGIRHKSGLIGQFPHGHSILSAERPSENLSKTIVRLFDLGHSVIQGIRVSFIPALPGVADILAAGRPHVLGTCVRIQRI